MKLQLIAVLTLALVGGVFGWNWAGRKRRRSFFEQPVGMSDRRFALIKQSRRVFRRLVIAGLFALAGALVGWLLAVLLHLH
jgi:hypothetical protein